MIKSITGGLLAQTAGCRSSWTCASSQVKTEREPTPRRVKALLFGWKVCKHVKSNAIVYARAGQTVSVGAGQMSRVDSVKVGAMKAVLPLAGTVLASDAFFPFPGRRGRSRQARHYRGDSAGRFGERRQSDCGGEPVGLGDGVYRRAAFPALSCAGQGGGPVGGQGAGRRGVAFFQMADGFGEAGGVRIVRHHDDGLAELAVEAGEHGEDIFGRGGVEVAGRLVGQDQVGISHDGARDSDALFLTTGKLLGQVAQAIAQADQFQSGFGVLHTLFLVELGQLQRQLDIFERGQNRDQVERLKNEANVVVAPVRNLLVIQRRADWRPAPRSARR